MRKLLIILTLSFFISACTLKKPKEIIPEPPIAITFFSFVDENNNDLLNPENPMAFNFNMPDYYGFKLYYVKNGVKEEAASKGGHPYIFMPNCNDGPVCILGVFLSESDTNILVLDDFDFSFSDTILKENNGHIIRYNGEVVWDAEVDSYRIPIATIMK